MLHASEVRRPRQVRRVGDRDHLGPAAAREVDGRRAEPIRAARRHALLEERLALDTVGVPEHRRGAVAAPDERAVCHREVVPDEVELRDPDAVGKNTFDGFVTRISRPVGLDELDLLLGHAATLPAGYAPWAMAVIDLVRPELRPSGRMDPVRGGDVPRSRGPPGGAHRRERDREVDAPSRDRGARDLLGPVTSTCRAGSGSCVSSSARTLSRRPSASSSSRTPSAASSDAGERVLAAERSLADRSDERAPARVRERAGPVGGGGRIPGRGDLGRLHGPPAFGQGYPECAERHIETLSGRRAQTARARGLVPLRLRRPVARRAGQLPGHRGQALARGADVDVPQDHLVREPRSRGARADRDARADPRGARRVDARRWIPRYGEARRRGSNSSRRSTAATPRSTSTSSDNLRELKREPR